MLGTAEFIDGPVQNLMRHTGPSMSPFNAWVLLKGLETLSLRVREAGRERPRGRPGARGHTRRSTRVLYPWLPSHPQHELARRQMLGGGTVVTFELDGGKDEAFALMNALQVIDICNNLGDAKSLVTHPATTTHRASSRGAARRARDHRRTVRLSVGLEDAATSSTTSTRRWRRDRRPGRARRLDRAGAHGLGTVDPWPAAALTAALGRDDPPGPGAELPPFWHQLYGHAAVHAAATGPDGHEARGEFLPLVTLPHRMWAGGRLMVHRPLRIGEAFRKASTVRRITPKQGRQGPLVFVLVEHRFETDAGDGAGRGAGHRLPRAGARLPPPVRPEPGRWRQPWRPDPVLLFRYSALTYNGHRIHYDADYAREVEGYPGLVVHGPLLATLMLDLVRREQPDRTLQRFAFRAVSPLMASEDSAGPRRARGRGGAGAAVDHRARATGCAMEGEAHLSSAGAAL